ncbi:MAG: alpha-amylase family glycosyl hydrolase, partial [Syntrophothermus sp.]
ISHFGDHSLMANISGANDLPRFISYASGALAPGEDYIKAGWDRNIKVSDSIAYKKLALLHCFNMTIPGIPVIYYGDEIGMAGAGEPDNRRFMRFDSLNPYESWLKNIVEKLTRLRRNSMPLLYGDLVPLEVTDKVFIFMRTYFDKIDVIIFNKNYTPEQVTFDLPERFSTSKITGHFGSRIKMNKKTVTLTLKGNSFEILSN